MTDSEGARKAMGRPRGAKNKSRRPPTEARQLSMLASLWEAADKEIERRGTNRRNFFESAVLRELERGSGSDS